MSLKRKHTFLSIIELKINVSAMLPIKQLLIIAFLQFMEMSCKCIIYDNSIDAVLDKLKATFKAIVTINLSTKNYISMWKSHRSDDKA